jgi:hypothetical protein
MAKWTRVGEIPKKIPVNFVVDSEKYPELAAWIYSFPHGAMGKTVRDILNHHAKLETGVGEPQPDRSGDDVRVQGGGQSPPRPALQVESSVGRAPAGDDPEPMEVRGMDAGTANTLRQLDQGF